MIEPRRGGRMVVTQTHPAPCCHCAGAVARARRSRPHTSERRYLFISILASNPAIIATDPSAALYSRCFQYNFQENDPPPFPNLLNRGNRLGTLRAYSSNWGKRS